jgi:hypothetical protein
MWLLQSCGDHRPVSWTVGGPKPVGKRQIAYSVLDPTPRRPCSGVILARHRASVARRWINGGDHSRLPPESAASLGVKGILLKRRVAKRRSLRLRQWM